jgi:uncharacterized protein (DUF488 family)
LIKELNSFEIKFVIDVRSKPYSKYNPHFNQNELKFSLLDSSIQYVFLGEQLGGLPTDLTCYTNGKVDYDKIKDKDFFKEGLNRLITAHKKHIKVAIMCSESNPKQCHRSKLIGEELRKLGISLNHIINENLVKDQFTVMTEVTKGLPMQNLFGETISFSSRKKYI